MEGALEVIHEARAAAAVPGGSPRRLERLAPALALLDRRHRRHRRGRRTRQAR